MSEQIESRQRRRELLIILAYSVFTVLMIIVSSFEDWPFYYIPLLLFGLISAWWCYIKQFQSYVFRAFVITAYITINVFLYGIQAEDFFVVIPTLCLEFVLLSLYEMTRVMDIVFIKSVCLFLYHLLIKGYTFPTTSTERNRIMLQSLSYGVLMVLCIYRIHHHNQEEQDTDALEEQVRREQLIRNDFVANTSHELRTPVNTISGMCEIILQKNLPDEIHNGVLDIQMTGAELQSIVTDILDYSALEADTMVLNHRIYNITSTLNDVMNTTMYENNSKHLDIIFDCDPNIPSQLEGDEQQLRRVLNTLIGNAIKFTQDGGVTVRVTYRPEEYGINLIVSVKDTGVGLSIEDQELILKGFYQTDSDRNRKSSGLGLGLPIASALIKKMGGFLTINSEEGVGSEFSFAIPQKVISEEPCISLLHPGSIKLVWFYNPRSTNTSVRNAFADHIQHFSEYFGILSYRATTLEECKRRVAQSQGVHLILGQYEYLENKHYFDELSAKVSIIIVADRNAVPNAGNRIHVLYKPYNAMMLAEILNGEFRSTKTRGKKELKKFIAPTAKILVVDDNLMNLKVVEGLLRKYRIRVVTAISGEEALSLIESQDYDFVFMDHMMPGMDGVECFHRIREKPGAYYSQVPIIALTANAIAGSREMFLGEGFSEFVAKPIDTSLLNEVLYRFIPFEKHLTEEDIRYLTQDDSGAKPAEAQAVAPAPAETAGSRPAQTAAAEKPEETAPQAESDSQDPFEALPFVNKEDALTYCGSQEDFLELAQVYLSSGLQYKDDLQNAFDINDLKNYALLAHTIKGTSRTLGISSLAETALTQELAAKEDREEDVRNAHHAFLDELDSVLQRLSTFFGKQAESAPVQEPAGHASVAQYNEIADWDGLKARLIKCLESYEEQAFDDALDEVRGQTLKGRPVEIVLADVLDKVAAFDFESAITILNKIGGAA